MTTVGTAVHGISNRASELALLLADATASEARKFVALRQAKADQARADQLLATAERTFQERSKALESARARRREVDGQSLRWPTLARRVNLVGLLAVAVAVPASAATHSPAVFLLLVAGAGAACFAARVARGKEAAARALVTAEAQALVTTREHEHEEASKAQMDCARACDEPRARCAALQPEQTLKAVVRASVPLTVLNIASYSLVSDRSGLTPRVPLRVPDLAANPKVVQSIRAAVDHARGRPVLLQSSSAEPSELDELQGEERDLLAALQAFSKLLTAIPTAKVDLPLVRADSRLTSYLSSALREPGALRRESYGRQISFEPRSDRDATATAITAVSDIAKRVRATGGDIGNVLRGLDRELNEILGDYRELRAGALDSVHQRLNEVLQRSDLAYVKYYCPKCNRVPGFLLHRLGIEIDTAHELDAPGLLDALQSDEETRQRMVSDQTIVGDLAFAWSAIRELDKNIVHLQQLVHASATEVGADLAQLQAFESRLRAMRSQRAQAIDQYRCCLRRAVTGNARPLLELSQQARLYLDPERNVWTCGACETAFDDPSEARMGRMLKIKDELLMPMWNHLWTEKDDFRKSELFRTNEQIQALMEKEAAALRDVAEQYRADMRPVRENLIISTTDAQTKRAQLESTVQSLAAMSVISKAEAAKSVDGLLDITGGDLGSLRKRAEIKETILNQEPQAQLSRRIPAIDPVDVFMSPETLFRGGDGERELVRSSIRGREVVGMSGQGGLSYSDVQGMIAPLENVLSEHGRAIAQLEDEMSRVGSAVDRMNENLAKRLDHMKDGQAELVDVQRTMKNITLEEFTKANAQLGMIQVENVTGFTKVVGGLGSVCGDLKVVDGSVQQMTRAVVQMEVIRILNEAQAPVELTKSFGEEIEQRFVKAVENVYFVRCQYDQLIGTAMNEYDRKLRTIGDHIFAIYEQDFRPSAEEPLSAPAEVALELPLSVDERRIEARSKALDVGASELARDLLGPLVTAQAEFEELLGSAYATDLEPVGELALPVVVRVRRSGAKEEVDVLAAAEAREAKGGDGGPRAGLHFALESAEALGELCSSLRSRGAELRRQLPTRPLDQDELAELKRALETLAAEGRIDADLLPGFFDYLDQFGLEVGSEASDRGAAGGTR